MNIIITGASRGIGYALVKKFFNLKKANIIVISRNSDKINELKVTCEMGNFTSKVIPIVYDLTELQNDSSALIEIINSFVDKIDILINNAGQLIKKPFIEFDPGSVEKLFKINLIAPSELIRLLIPKMNTPSHIINISSMGGYQGSSKFPGLSIYSASKAALANLTECLAEEFKENEIYFNCLALGAVNTEMFEEAFPRHKAPLSAEQMADFIYDFALNGYKYFNGKILPVSISTP